MKPVSEWMADPMLWALAYASKGYHVLPLRSITESGQCDCGSVECREDETKRAKHPRTSNGYKDATADEEQIRAWWTWWPNANVGIATINRLVVVDVDPRHCGDATWERLIEDRELPAGPVVRTGSGGWHDWFYGRVERQGADALGPGVDLKAEVGGRAGYVIVPPSVTSMGGYTWKTVGVPLPPLPEWLHPEVKPTPQLRINDDGEATSEDALGTLRRLATKAAGRADGERRRDGLYVAGLVLSHYCPPLEVETIVRVLTAAGVESGLSADVARMHVSNGLKTALGVTA